MIVGDAYLLADLLRTDGHRFRPLTPPSDAIRAPARAGGAVAMTSSPLACTRNRIACLARKLLARCCAIFADIDSPIALAFPERLPHARQRHASGREASCELPCTAPLQRADAARTTPRPPCAQHPQRPCRSRRSRSKGRDGSCPRCRFSGPLVTRILDLTAAHPPRYCGQARDGQIIMSFPRAGQLCAGSGSWPELGRIAPAI